MLFKFIQCIVFGVLSSQLAIHHLRFLGVFFFLFTVHVQNIEGLPVGSVSKDSSCNIGDTGSIPGLGRSPREGNSNPLQYSHLGNPMDRRAWRATVHGVTKQSDMTEQLNNNSKTLKFKALILSLDNPTFRLLLDIWHPCYSPKPPVFPRFYIYSSLYMGYSFQDFQWMPETLDSTKLNIDYGDFFLFIHT